MTAPNIAENTWRGTPSQSVHVPYLPGLIHQAFADIENDSTDHASRPTADARGMMTGVSRHDVSARSVWFALDIDGQAVSTGRLGPDAS